LLDSYLTLTQERVRIRELLAELGPTWRSTRSVLNELSDIVNDAPLPSSTSRPD